MKKIFNQLSEYLINNNIMKPLSTGLTVFLLLGASFYSADIYPFGINTIAWGDMRQQIVPLMLQLKEILSGNQSLFFHTGSAGGSNFWGIFFFYLSSPFSLIIFLSDKINPFHLINIIAAGKIITAGVTVNIMFEKMFPKMNFFYAYVLSISYAFCGFSLMFYQNVIWLDMLYLLPLLVLGIYKLHYENKVFLYVFILSSMLIVNFYMSYMIVLFIIFYFAVFFFSVKNTQIYKNKFIIIAFSTFFSALLTSFVWLPSFFQYQDSSRGISILDSLRRGEFFTSYETTLSSVFPSSILFIIFPLIIFNYKKIKIPTQWLILFFLTLIPIFIEPVNKMWHTGSYQAFPARYSYITVLMGLIVLAYYFSDNYFSDNYFSDNIIINSNKTKTYLKCLILPISILFTGVLLAFYVTTFKNKEISSYVRTLWTNTETFKILLLVFLVFAFLYSMLIMLLYLHKCPHSIIKIVLIALILTEILFNTGIYFGIPSNSPERYSNVLDLRNEFEVKNLSRMKIKEKYFDVNLTGGLGYPSIGTYTSLTSTKYMTIMKKLGFSSYWMEVSSSQGTIFSDILMSNRYTVIENTPLNLLPGQKILYSNSKYSVAEQYNAFYPVIPISEEALNLLVDIPDGTRFDIQNHLFRSLTGSSENLLEKYAPNESTHNRIHYKVDVKENTILYFDYFHEVTNKLVEPINDTFNIYVNDNLVSDSYPNKRVNGILELGEFENETVAIDIQIIKPVKVNTYEVCGLNTKFLLSEIEEYNKLNYIDEITRDKNKINIILNEKFEFNQSQYPYLMVTIPYAGDIKVLSDGNVLDSKEIFGGFTAIKIPENTKLVEIIYTPKAMFLSIVISLLSLIAGIAVFIFRKKLLQLKLLIHVNRILKFTFLVFSGILFFTIYIFPIIYFLLK